MFQSNNWEAQFTSCPLIAALLQNHPWNSCDINAGWLILGAFSVKMQPGPPMNLEENEWLFQSVPNTKRIIVDRKNGTRPTTVDWCDNVELSNGESCRQHKCNQTNDWKSLRSLSIASKCLNILGKTCVDRKNATRQNKMWGVNHRNVFDNDRCAKVEQKCNQAKSPQKKDNPKGTILKGQT